MDIKALRGPLCVWLPPPPGRPHVVLLPGATAAASHGISVGEHRLPPPHPNGSCQQVPGHECMGLCCCKVCCLVMAVLVHGGPQLSCLLLFFAGAQHWRSVCQGSRVCLLPSHTQEDNRRLPCIYTNMVIKIVLQMQQNEMTWGRVSRKMVFRAGGSA